MFTPRSDGVSMRWRNSCGRMSPTRCVARVGVAVGVAVEAGDAAAGPSSCGGRRSALNCCCGNGVTQQPQAFELLRVQDALEQLVEVVDA